MIYPPILNSTQQVFAFDVFDLNPLVIHFQLQKLSSILDFNHVQVRIMFQSNNIDAVDYSIWPDGAIYYKKDNPDLDLSDTKNCRITIRQNYLKGKSWRQGDLYKVQIRFGYDSILPWYPPLDSSGRPNIYVKNPNADQFATWKKDQIDANNFSDWSTVMVIKPIVEPIARVANFDDPPPGTTIDSSWRVKDTTPLFVGSFSSDSVNGEYIDKYKFDLYLGVDSELGNLLESSGWLQHNESEQTTDQYRFHRILDTLETYVVKYSVITQNGYQTSSIDYPFKAYENYLNQIKNLSIKVESESLYCQENGCIQIKATANDLNGNYVITRASEKDGFTYWEELKYLLIFDTSFDDEVIFEDFTIESGIKYRYAIQLENKSGIRTPPIFEDGNNPHFVNFEYAYLYRNDIQLKLKFDNTMNSFKHTILANKQDTLGSKYAYLSRNGDINYAEFPINGLISIHTDDDEHFFKKKSNGFYYKDELVIPQDKYDEDNYKYDLNLTHDNIFIERKFREKVEEFLNDFNYKLYKSPTEGNIVVALQNVTLTPKQELGRMIFSFSATAYEVGEADRLSKLNEYGILDTGSYDDDTLPTRKNKFGQVNGSFVGLFDKESGMINQNAVNLVDLIKKNHEESKGGGFKEVVKKIKSIWIENYPALDFHDEILELEGKISELNKKGEDISELSLKLAEYRNLSTILANTPTTKIVPIRINGQDVNVGINKVYSLYNIEGGVDHIYLKYSGPILLNYVCETMQEEDQPLKITEQVDGSIAFGQISGVFTETESIIRNYNYEYQKPREKYDFSLKTEDQVINIHWNNDGRIYDNGRPGSFDERIKEIITINDKEFTPYEHIIGDNTFFNIFQNTNIFELIEQDAKANIAHDYGIAGFDKYDEEEKQWYDSYDTDAELYQGKKIYYQFNELLSVSIEAEPGTKLWIGNDKENAIQVSIGVTGKYNINPVEKMIQYLAFDKPTFAIINYKAYTTQMWKGQI